MTFNSQELINDLIGRTTKCIENGRKFKDLDTSQLNFKNSKESWSILECLEHLNRYGEFYLPEIERVISKASSNNDTFISSWLGNYFANSMLVTEDKIKPMKTFKVMNPVSSKLNENVIEKFLLQQTQYLELLNRALLVNLTKNKTSISISYLIKLRLGDTLRVVVYHNERHVWQANKLLE